MELLRFFTAGNVDDGKSTLIGRLLLDSNSVSTDIIETLTRQSKASAGNAAIDLALLTDGLRAEREQGITIDVAYKYFTTAKRKFIIADTPGHAQYTRNMFTGASAADLAIILVDARKGITEQTRRHSMIVSILGIPRTIVCINKMDLVSYGENVFAQIVAAYAELAEQLGLENITFIPVSALEGDNVAHGSAHMPWYNGPSLLEFLEEVPLQSEKQEFPARFQVQYVIRPQTRELHDYRGYAGSVLSGRFKTGDRVAVLPSGMETTLLSIERDSRNTDTARAGDPVIFHLEDDVDVSRGSSIVPVAALPVRNRNQSAVICWMDNASFHPGQQFVLQHNSFRTKAVVREIIGKTDIRTLRTNDSDLRIGLNDFARVMLKTAEEVSYDPYAGNRKNGAFILISEHTNNTVAAGVFIA